MSDKNMQRARAYDGLRLFMMTGGVGVGVGVSCPKLNFEIQLVCANMFLAFQTNFGEITSLFLGLVSTSFQIRFRFRSDMIETWKRQKYVFVR